MSACFVRTVAILLSAAAFQGCKEPAKQSIIDSEGRRFVAQCDSKGRCELASKPTDSDVKPSERFQLRRTGRVVGICPQSAPDAPSEIAECRPLVCHSDAECPPAEALPHGVCINQLCTEPSHDVIVDDAIQLCLAGTGTGPRTAMQVERMALGLNCGNPCQIPKPCRPL